MRVAAGLVFVTVALIAASALAGLGFAGTSPSAAQYEYGKQVAICHHTSSKQHPWVNLKIDIRAWPAHLQRGDTYGACSQAQLNPPKQFRDGKQVAICHHTNSKQHPWVNMKINIRAWPGHLKHGDTFGACTQEQLNPEPPKPATPAPPSDNGNGNGHGHGHKK
jgi:hypothetical protein